MNRKQKIVVGIGLAIILAMGLFPPWLNTVSFQGTIAKKPAGFSFLFHPPDIISDDEFYGVILDSTRLLVQWFLVILVAGGLILIFKESKADN